MYRFRSADRAVFSFLAFTLALMGSPAAHSDPPQGYYDSAAGLSGESLRLALHDIIDDHDKFPYTSSATDTWDILGISEQDPTNPANVITFYRNTSVSWFNQATTDGWNREHTWPSSYGYTNDGSCNYPFSDVHQLRAASPSYNSARSNRPYDWCTSSAGCEAWPAAGTPYSNLSSGFGSGGSWQAWEERRGDAARAILYMETRYEGGSHGLTGCAEPDLRVTDDRALIVSDTTQNLSVAYMGLLSVLLEWHLEDPVSAEEQQRNDDVFGFQGNRNPYIDHPEFVCLIWACPSSDVTPPAVPTGLAAVAGECQVALDWNDNFETDLASYSVYRSTDVAGPFAQISTISAVSAYTDTSAEGAVQYHYQVTATDVSGNESGPSGLVSAIPTTGQGCGAPPPDPGQVNLIISELMPNPFLVSDTDGEWFEVFNRGTAAVDLNGWTIRDDDIDLHVINSPGGLVIQPNQFLVLARNGDSLVNGGLIADYVYGGNFILANSADEVVLLDLNQIEHTRVNYGSATFPYQSGISAEISDLLAPVVNDPLLWVATITPYGNGDLGTPGNEGSATLPPPPTGNQFIRGDANQDSSIDISDPIMVLEYLFGAGTQLSCPDAADGNDDGELNIADAVGILQFLFNNAGPLPAPYPDAGEDPTSDSLGC
ncbi:MAG: endonuclease [Planctomycetota bacterium]|nr:endonuclease [Planctomycetota bacterium]